MERQVMYYLCDMKRLTTEEFIERAKKIHGDKYGYSKVTYVNSKTKVIIICPTHGEYYQKPNDHITGYGCPRCGGTMKLNTEQFIDKAKKVHGNRYSYDKCRYTGIDSKITIICNIHNVEFEQTAYNHIQAKVSCPLCYEDKYSKKKDGYWTYERCYEVAKKYEWLSDFMNEENSCYLISLRNGYIKDFTWLKRYYDEDEDITTSKKHCIYKYELSQFNMVYIGLTIDLGKRHKGHCKQGSLFNYCRQVGIVVPRPQIIEDNLTIEEAKIREGYWIDYYKKQGYKLLNKVKAGSVGTISVKRLYKQKK